MDSYNNSKERRQGGTSAPFALGFFAAVFAFYFSSYIAMIWLESEASLIVSRPRPGLRIILTITLILVCLLLTFAVGKFDRFRGVFTVTLASLLVGSILLGLPLLDTPVANGTTSWLAVPTVFLQGGRNPVSLALLSCITFQGFLTMNSHRRALSLAHADT